MLDSQSTFPEEESTFFSSNEVWCKGEMFLPYYNNGKLSIEMQIWVSENADKCAFIAAVNTNVKFLILFQKRLLGLSDNVYWAYQIIGIKRIKNM